MTSLSDRKRVVVIGSNFAGTTIALEVRRLAGPNVEIVVLDPRPRFTFVPSLVWLPFGKRSADDITFALEPMYAKKSIEFVNEAAVKIDLDARTVTSSSGKSFTYDRLAIGTGPRLAFEKIPGLGPEQGFTQSVCNLDHGILTGKAWQRFLQNPGPVIVGTAPGASCLGASYEFMLNTAHQIRKAGLADKAPVTFVSAEPYFGHFGLGGIGNSRAKMEKFIAKTGIDAHANVAIKEVRDGEMEFEDGTVRPFAFSMIIPPFAGVEVVKDTPGLANPAGFIPVTDRYRHPDLPEVYAAGVAIALAPKVPTPVPTGVPKTGQMTEIMAKVAAKNIVADLKGTTADALPPEDIAAMCMLDGGDNGVVFKANHVLAGADSGIKQNTMTMAGPQAHLAKVAFEKVFLATRSRGRVFM